MVGMAKNDYRDMAQDIMVNGDGAEALQGQEAEDNLDREQVSTSLFTQAMEQIKSENGGVMPSGSTDPATDSDIYGIVLNALQMSDGSPEQIMDALGANNYSMDEAEKSEFIARLTTDDIQEKAQVIEDYMQYASPGIEALVQVLGGLSNTSSEETADEVVDENLMQEQMQP